MNQVGGQGAGILRFGAGRRCENILLDADQLQITLELVIRLIKTVHIIQMIVQNSDQLLSRDSGFGKVFIRQFCLIIGKLKLIQPFAGAQPLTISGQIDQQAAHAYGLVLHRAFQLFGGHLLRLNIRTNPIRDDVDIRDFKHHAGHQIGPCCRPAPWKWNPDTSHF